MFNTMNLFKAVSDALNEDDVLKKILDVVTSPIIDANEETTNKYLGEFKKRDIQNFIGKVMVPTMKFMDSCNSTNQREARESLYFLNDYLSRRDD